MNLTEYQKAVMDKYINLAIHSNPVKVRIDLVECLVKLGFPDEYFNRTSPILNSLRKALLQHIKNHNKLKEFREITNLTENAKLVYIFIKSL